MMKVFDQIYLNNIEVLKQVHPELAAKVDACTVPDGLEVIQSKNGLPVLKNGNISYHSIYDPEREGLRFVETNLKNNAPEPGTKILFFGMGFGYHIIPLLKHNISAEIFEPEIEIIKAASRQVDLTAVFRKLKIVTEINEYFIKEDKFILWPHPPSIKNNAGIYEALQKIVEGAAIHSTDKPLLKEKLKITVVSPIYGGSLPVAGYCVRALKELGHDVEFWDASVFAAPFEKLLNMEINESNKRVLYDLFQHLISEMVLASCSEKKPDILFALAQAPVSIKALERLKQANVLTAFWFVEDYKHMDYWKSYSRYYDFYFTIQKGEFFNQLEKSGANNYFYLPMAADPDIHCIKVLSEKDRAEFGSSLSFMGAGYYNRQIMFSKIKSCDFKIWGNSWDPDSAVWDKVQRAGERVTTDETVKIFNASDINLNLHSFAYEAGINPEGDFVNPRTFEIASCGAFQLVDKRGYLKDSFVPGEEIICFETENEMHQLIDFYLNNPELRKKIAEKSRQRVLKDHTYAHRMSEMLTFIKERKPEYFLENTGAKLKVKDKKSFIQDFPEVEPVISRAVNEQGELNMESIVHAVKSRDTELNYSEAIFLLMDEFKNLFAERSL